MKTNALFASVPLALVTLACASAPAELTPDQAAAQTEFASAEAPTPQHPLDIRYQSRMRLIGYDISAEQVTLGQPLEITWYWQVDRRLPGEWALFTHIADASGVNRCNADHTRSDECAIEAPMRDRYAPSLWSEGSWVADHETITIPESWHSDEVVFYIGIYSGDHRLSITSGPNDGESRGRALTLRVGGASASLVTGTTGDRG